MQMQGKLWGQFGNGQKVCVVYGLLQNIKTGPDEAWNLISSPLKQMQQKARQGEHPWITVNPSKPPSRNKKKQKIH